MSDCSYSYVVVIPNLSFPLPSRVAVSFLIGVSPKLTFTNDVGAENDILLVMVPFFHVRRLCTIHYCQRRLSICHLPPIRCLSTLSPRSFEPSNRSAFPLTVVIVFVPLPNFLQSSLRVGKLLVQEALENRDFIALHNVPRKPRVRCNEIGHYEQDRHYYQDGDNHYERKGADILAVQNKRRQFMQGVFIEKIR